MTDVLTLEDVDESVKSKVYVQDYTAQKQIAGAKLVNIDHIVGDDGGFAEVMRLKDNGEMELFPKFKLAQVNRTRLIPGNLKAWHLHFKQDEIWYILPRYQLLVGLWDIRKNSSTRGVSLKFNLGGGKSQLLFIPRGVAHGSINLSLKEVEMFYFMSQQFNIKDPDEQRVPWDSLGADFWKPHRD